MQNADEQMSRPPVKGIVWGIVLNASIPLILYKLSKRYVSPSEFRALVIASTFPLGKIRRGEQDIQRPGNDDVTDEAGDVTDELESVSKAGVFEPIVTRRQLFDGYDVIHLALGRIHLPFSEVGGVGSHNRGYRNQSERKCWMDFHPLPPFGVAAL
jgi:hypothetical protein